MPRTVYLIVPQTDGNQDIRKLIHATGDARNGFQIAFKRNYDLTQVANQHVVDVKGDKTKGTDATAHNYLKQVALSIPAPGRSLQSATSQGSRQRVDIQNCQTWLRAVVATLVQNRVIAEGALQVVDTAPKN
ncbi:hypothetical protein BKA63DRAFT_535692 [Paraphoma chrysanthemicola]|nr:hypothetical protein BKA63DRAFT_535692 [Paraphoma chrysanthemicola]